MSMMQIKLNNNPVLNLKVKHTKKPQIYIDQRNHQGYRILPK